jgi:hypothetical protein
MDGTTNVRETASGITVIGTGYDGAELARRRAAAQPTRARSLASVTATFVRAAGMADDVALIWLDAAFASWSQVWQSRGGEVLAELWASGHPRLVDRLVELLGQPNTCAGNAPGAA